MFNRFFDFFLVYFGSFFIKRAASYFFDFKVKNLLHESSGYFKISDRVSAKKLYKSRVFRGLANSYLNTDDKLPNALDFAVAIKVSLAEYDSKYNDTIIDLSYHLFTEIKRFLYTDSVLKKALKNLDKSIKDIENENSRAQILNILENKKLLFTHYFKGFIDSRYHFSIRVWHQANKKSWIDNDVDNSLVININPLRIREGFFIIGFDYTRLSDGETLKVACNENGYEYFNQYSKNNIWVR